MATLPTLGYAYFGVIVLFSVACGFFTVPLFATLQIAADPNRKARTIAANNIMNAIFMVVGTLMTSLVIGTFKLSSGEVFIMLGVLTIGLGFFLSRALLK